LLLEFPFLNTVRLGRFQPQYSEPKPHYAYITVTVTCALQRA
jgi:hypothetical protein